MDFTGGKVVMIMIVILSILVYLMHLFHIMQATINKIESIIPNFLWYGVVVVKKFQLTGLNSIARFVQKGGWGIIKNQSFNLSLVVVRICRLLFEKGLWKNIMFGKYIK